jgi:hypothetical protein
MKHIAIAAVIATLAQNTATASPIVDNADPAPRVDAQGVEPSVELASYFSFMRSFGRICYSDAVGWYYC